MQESAKTAPMVPSPDTATSQSRDKLDDIPISEKLGILREQRQDMDDVPISHRLVQLKRKQEAAVGRDKKEGSGKKLKAVVKVKEEPNGFITPTFNPEKKPSEEPVKERIYKTKGEKGEAIKKVKADKTKGEERKVIKKELKEKKGPKNEDNGFDDEEDNEEYKWWEAGLSDNSVKWSSLEHNGPLFPPSYQTHNVPLIYDGRRLQLEPEAEEVAGFFAALLGTDHAANEVFQRNFFDDFLQVLRECNSKYDGVIKEFSKCDFALMHQHFEDLKEKKKAMSKADKETLKAQKTEQEKQFGFALLDGRKEKIGSFRIEPPGLFRGRGKHPKTGKFKRRVHPEQVTVNIGAGAKVPEPPAGHTWGRVISDNTVTWLATWVENINGAQKYVFLAPGSSLKGQSDLRKFETARRLKEFVAEIRRVNVQELHDKEMFVRQRATALWLIDHLALRAGNEKGDDEADTVGCCSLRCEHILLEAPSAVIFDFLGKDSIRYYNRVQVEPIIFKNLGIFMRPPKEPSDPIFDRLNTSTLNKYLNGLMDGLTAKVFRTYNASHTFQLELEKTPDEASVAEKILAYNRANREVAILCNHQRSVPKTHGQSMERMKEKILMLKYQRWLLRRQIKDTFDKRELKKSCPEALDDAESELDDKVRKRKAQEAEEERIAKYRKAHPDEPDTPVPPSPQKKINSIDVAVKKLSTLSARIHAAKHLLIDKDENKTTALGTSKTNYIDPRITAAWCSKNDVPIEKMFPKTLREKFKWAMTVEREWAF